MTHPEGNAPDFALPDAHGTMFRLSDFRGRPVILAFLRGFRWPFCLRHLSQLRDQYDRLTERGAAVLAVAPEEVIAFSEATPMPFPCLADPKREVFRLYGVGSGITSLGQRPAVFLIGPEGEIRVAWRGKQQWDIPSVDEIVKALEAEKISSEPK